NRLGRRPGLTIIAIGFLLVQCFLLNIQGTLAADPIFAQQARLTLGVACQSGDRFGNGVVKGNWAVFGMPYKDVATSQDQGVVYLYQRSGTTWTLAQTLIAGDGNAYDHFGGS